MRFEADNEENLAAYRELVEAELDGLKTELAGAA